MDRTAPTINLEDVANALAWWREAGVDTLIEESPRDWLAKPAPSAPASSRRDAAPLSSPAGIPASAGMTRVEATGADLPADLVALRRHYETAPDLPFAGAGATRVLPSGDPASGLMILADMPSAEDAAEGAIFSGETGLLFDRMLAAIGRDRASVYLATLSCLAAPGGRLDADTAGQCGALARHHVKLASPRRVLLLGEAAVRVMTGLALPAARGRVHHLDLEGRSSGEGGRVNAVATYHPRYLLQRPAAKAGAWADLQLLVEGYDE